MDIDVRLATAPDRTLIEEFYVREGLNFQQLVAHTSSTPVGVSIETMYVVAATRGMVVAALKLDIAKDPALGKIGFIKHFEIEDALESTDLGSRMLQKAIEIADDKGLRALDAVFDISRSDLIDLYTASEFKEERKEVVMRKDFGLRVF
ncbi:MAG: hypothetical protein ACW98U_11865 [Candidatus Thorarchaeota archaeon]|jgi:GNAT superfamily N-acetyltransferase